MLNKINEMNENERIKDYYKEKSVFITGASGFLGSVILATLLYYVPDIKACYILIRPKQNTDPNGRKNILFKNKVFRPLLEKDPSAANKVHVISGDIMLQNLGISEDDEKKLVEEISVMFHVAASISFQKSLKDLVQHNSFGTLYAVEFAKKIRKLEVFVYCSTAFGNCNRIEVEEVVYRFPFRAQLYLDALRDDSSDTFEKLVEKCKPEFHNNYLFSKCLCENIVNEMAVGFPVAIVRPSIVYAAANPPIKGFNNEKSGLMLILNTVLRGLIRYSNAHPDTNFHLVPVDISANCHIAAGWAVGTKRMKSPLVVHSSCKPVSVRTFVQNNYDVVESYPMPHRFLHEELGLIPNKYIFFLFQIYDHYIPSFFFDIYLKMIGRKISLIKFYNQFTPIRTSLEYFALTNFHMKMDIHENLVNIMHPEDKEIFSIDASTVDLREISFHIPESGFSDAFDWTKDKLTIEERSKEMKKNKIILYTIKYTEIAVLCLSLYWIISMLF